MKVQDVSHAPQIHAPRNHPGYALIEAERIYEEMQLGRISKLNAENQRTTMQLSMLDQGMNILMDLSEKKPVDHDRVLSVFDSISRDFPQLGFDKFADTCSSLNENEIEHAKQKLTTEEKRSLSKLNPKMSQIEELCSDKTKVHEIVAEIIKLLTEADKHSTRNQQVRG